MKVSAMAAAAAAGQHEVELADTPAKPEDYIRCCCCYDNCFCCCMEG